MATWEPWVIGKRPPNGAYNIETTHGLMTAQATDENNAEFIAHAREDVLALLAEIERLTNVIIHAEYKIGAIPCGILRDDYRGKMRASLRIDDLLNVCKLLRSAIGGNAE